MKLLRREGLPKRASLVYGFLGAATVWTGKLNHTRKIFEELRGLVAESQFLRVLIGMPDPLKIQL